MKTLPQPWSATMEATTFSGWIYDHLEPHAVALKVAHPLMLRTIAAAKKKSYIAPYRDPRAATHAALSQLAGSSDGVWFYSKREPRLRGQHTRRRIRKELHRAPPKRVGRIFAS